MSKQKGIELLKQARDKLNSYREEVDGDYNDSLAIEIHKYLVSIGEEIR